MTVYLAGVKTTVAGASDTAVTRPATNVSKVLSITVTNAGAIAVVAGTSGATVAFSETRGAAGGPPFIAVDSVEVAQVRLTSSTPAPILESEIFAVVNTHRELSSVPSYTTNNYTGTVNLDYTPMLNHTANVPKRIYASYAEPVFVEQRYGNDFVPAETTHSVNSEATYTGAIASSSESVGQGSFTAILTDGITDGILALKNQIVMFRFYQDRAKSPYILTQGKLGISRTFGASDNPKVTCTISSSTASLDRNS
jgi:hypothetical protein